LSVLKCSGGIFDIENKSERLLEVESVIVAPDFWDDNERAQDVMKERTSLTEAIASVDTPYDLASECLLLLDMGEEEAELSVLEEVGKQIPEIESYLEALEFQRMLGGPADRADAILSINSGAGGLESQDWASMLQRMYLRWSDSKGYKVAIVDMVEGDEAGIKSATFTIEGDFAFGNLKAEAGVHRLVRISPFDANARRHTSFASVYVFPEVDDDIEIEVNEGDLRIDTYRASGAGGQHVNKTDSAIRITHLPTGIVVQCQNQRSQHKNRSTAMKLLKSRLYALELEEREKEMEAIYADKKEIGFGSQIRSYVLHPYRMVKDHRTNIEKGNTDAVLDGDLDEFIRGYLLSKNNPIA
jgi:peptide chain release factor 2